MPYIRLEMNVIYYNENCIVNSQVYRPVLQNANASIFPYGLTPYNLFGTAIAVCMFFMFALDCENCYVTIKHA